MFENCYNLIELNLENFNFKRVNEIDFIFSECKNLNKIVSKNMQFVDALKNH